MKNAYKKISSDFWKNVILKFSRQNQNWSKTCRVTYRWKGIDEVDAIQVSDFKFDSPRQCLNP